MAKVNVKALNEINDRDKLFLICTSDFKVHLKPLYRILMYPVGRDNGSFFCREISFLGGGDLQTSLCKCPGVPRDRPSP